MPTPTNRRDLAPVSALPAAYFILGHLGLAFAFSLLVVRPEIPGGFFYHPRMVAVVHLLTLSWISGSILGAFYIVAPLALRMPMPVHRADWIGCGAFTIGTLVMVGRLWTGDYTGMVPGALLVTSTLAFVAARAWRGLRHAVVPGAVKLHVALAFANILLAALFGMAIGMDRSLGWFGFSPLAATYAHAHLAAIGWATMMVVGLSYRLIPMMLPAAMPTGRRLYLSAILIESGLFALMAALLSESNLLPLAALLIVAGLASFVTQVRRTLAHRLPRPPALPRRDWSTWQTHVALLWLFIAVGLGMVSSTGIAGGAQSQVQWAYGVAGLLGFLAQIIVGMQGRLVPLYAWYRAFGSAGAPPARAANDLPSPSYARPIFVLWTIGVPCLLWGLVREQQTLISLSAAVLLVAVVIGLGYLAYLLQSARAMPMVGVPRDESRDAGTASMSNHNEVREVRGVQGVQEGTGTT